MSPKSEPKTYFEQTGHRHVYKVTLPDTYVIAAEVKAIGGDPLMFHKVRILEAESGEPIGDVLTTDENGIVRATVPKNTKYRIEILEDDFDAHGTPVPEEPLPGVLICDFVDASGSPLPDHEVKVRFDEQELLTATDENGRIELSTHLGDCQVEIDEQIFEAHAVTLQDYQKGEGVYLLFVEAKAGSEDADDESKDPEERLERPELPPEDEEDLDR